MWDYLISMGLSWLIVGLLTALVVWREDRLNGIEEEPSLASFLLFLTFTALGWIMYAIVLNVALTTWKKDGKYGTLWM